MITTTGSISKSEIRKFPNQFRIFVLKGCQLFVHRFGIEVWRTEISFSVLLIEVHYKIHTTPTRPSRFFNKKEHVNISKELTSYGDAPKSTCKSEKKNDVICTQNTATVYHIDYLYMFKLC